MTDDYWDRQRDHRRADDARYDRERGARDQAEAGEQGWRALAAGDTAAAIRAVAGPDAALSYLDGMADSAEFGDEAGPGSWPPYQFPEDLFEFTRDIDELVLLRIELVRCERSGANLRLEAYGQSGGEEYFIGSCLTPTAIVERYVTRASGSDTGRVVRLLQAVLDEEHGP